MGKRIDHTGQVFGRLTAIAPSSERAGNGNVAWRCICECGREAIVSGNSLRAGDTRSCGCLFLEVAAEKGRTLARKHGMTGSRTHNVWLGMRSRCTDRNSPKWSRYGGRGISVCERWQCFKDFLADMGECPPGKSLDRWPNQNGNYEPGNCRWATDREQQNNRTNNRIIVVAGEAITVSQAARRHGLSPDVVYERLNRGDSPEHALRPARPIRKPMRQPARKQDARIEGAPT